MGVIQQGINQLLGTVAIGAKLNPKLETKRELKNIDKQTESSSKKVKAQFDYLKKNKDKMSDDDLIEQLEINQEVTKDVTRLMKQKLELNPSLNTYTEYLNIKSQNNMSKNLLDIAKKSKQMKKLEEERGQKRAEEKAQKQLKDKQRFEEFKEMFTEGGRYK